MSTEAAATGESPDESDGANAAIAALGDTVRTFLTLLPQLALLSLLPIVVAAIGDVESVVFAIAPVLALSLYLSVPFVQRDMVMPQGVGSVLGKFYFLGTRLLYYTAVVFVATVFGVVFATNYGLPVGVLVAAIYGIYDFEMGDVGLPVSLAGAIISIQRLIGTLWYLIRGRLGIERGGSVEKFRALPFNNIIFYPSLRWDAD